jgi:plastocyanin
MELTSLRPVRLTALAAVLLLGGLAACGGDDSSTATGGDGTTTTAAGGSSDDGYGTAADDGGDDGSGSEADEYVVVAKNIAFTDDLTVEPGEEFTFDNQDSTTHTLTADDGAFDSGEVSGGSQSDPIAAPDAAGAYTFHCEIHASMTGTLTVS